MSYVAMFVYDTLRASMYDSSCAADVKNIMLCERGLVYDLDRWGPRTQPEQEDDCLSIKYRPIKHNMLISCTIIPNADKDEHQEVPGGVKVDAWKTSAHGRIHPHIDGVTICVSLAFQWTSLLHSSTATTMTELSSPVVTPIVRSEPPLTLALGEAQLVFIPTDGFRTCFVTSLWVHTARRNPTQEETEVYEDRQDEISVGDVFVRFERTSAY